MKKLLILSIICMFGFALTMNAQVVKDKPKQPEKIVTKAEVEKPATNVNWVWVTAEWDWKSKSNEYKFVQPHWEKAQDKKNHWHAGYWKKVKDGWKWESGYWE
jgi:hypothetical protein